MAGSNKINVWERKAYVVYQSNLCAITFSST